MKNRLFISFFSILLCGCFSFTSAQLKTDSIDLRPLLYSKFLDADIIKKDGSINRASVNYNTNNQSIIFQSKKEFMELTGLNEIDLIVIARDTFCPIEGKVYKKTDSDNLYISYSNRPVVNVMSATKRGSGVENAKDVSNQVTGVYVSQTYKNLNDLEYVQNFWLMKDHTLLEMSNLKKISKAFNKNHKEVKEFIKINKLDIRNYFDISTLLRFLSGN